MNVQVIMRDGSPEYAVLPWDEYQALLNAVGAQPTTVMESSSSQVPKPALKQLSILREAQGTLSTLQNEPLREADLADRASSETDWSIELRTRDRQRKLISKIDSALRRIDNGEYGYCEMTGEPISLKRLDARPIATMTLEAQERHERRERVHRDD